MDLLWRHAVIDVANGPNGEVYVPTRYPLASSSHWTEAHRAVRATDWEGEDDSVVTGIGQRVWLVGANDLPIMEIKSIQFKRDDEPARTDTDDVSMAFKLNASSDGESASS